MGRAKPKPRPAARANTRTRPTVRPPTAAAKPPAPAAKPPAAAAKPPASITPADIVQALPEVTEQAEQVAAGDALPEPPEASGTVDGVSLTRLWRDVMQIKLAYEHAHTRLTEQQQHVDADQAALSQQQRAWEQQRGEWDAQRAEADQRAATAEKDLCQRRADSDERDERLADLELRLAQQEAGARSAASNAVREALTSERAALGRERDELSQQREKLRGRDTELRAREEDLQDWDELFQQRLQIGIQRATEQQKLRLTALEQRHTDLLAENQRLEGALTEYGRIQRAFPDFDPERVLAEQRRLEEEVRDLRGRQPRADVLADLTRLREESQRWQEDRSFLLAETERLQLQLSAYQVTAFELDRQEAVKQALQATAEAYKDEVQRLRDQADGLRRRAEGISPFPECSKMDEEYQQARDDLTPVLPPLAKFVRWLRHYIAQQDGLFYSEADLRLFLAGLAATRLHLLQGVSGIGKTQLPLAVAKAIGAAAVPVAVGADWRTPQDLTGYYNAFERRFYESEFTQAIYQAGCPAFLAQPFFVVLDEMNLSHPEQYFSAVLSALEIRKKGAAGQMTVELMTTEVQPSPRGLIQGRRLVLPPNLWFIGTANQDETTVAFAEKTFDRSNVLELPAQPEGFQPEPTDSLGAVSLEALREAFAAAERDSQTARTGPGRAEMPAEAVKRFLNGDLAQRLYQDFRISVGPRSTKHLDQFVPVVCAAGGTVREAADHVLAMKVLRKIRGRYELRADSIEAFRDELPKYWAVLTSAGTADQELPDRSIRLLDDELHRRGGQ